MTSIEEVQYFQKLIKDDFLMPKISQTTNLFDTVDKSIILEIDKLTNTNLFMYRKDYSVKTNMYKNKKTRYNIPNATISRHDHIR